MKNKTKVYKVTVAFETQEFWIKTHSKKEAMKHVIDGLSAKKLKTLVDNKNTSVEEPIE